MFLEFEMKIRFSGIVTTLLSECFVISLPQTFRDIGALSLSDWLVAGVRYHYPKICGALVLYRCTVTPDCDGLM